MKIISWGLFLFICLLASCGGDGESTVMRWTGTNDTIYELYVGSDKGGQKVNLKDNVKDSLKVDSLQGAYIRKFIGSNYKADLYKDLSVEFYETRLTYTYIDSLGKFKMIVPYEFKGDSLLAFKSGNKPVFVALGTTSELYRLSGISRYRSPFNDKDTVAVFDNKKLDLEQVLSKSKYKTLADMKTQSDTIMWMNVKYKFGYY